MLTLVAALVLSAPADLSAVGVVVSGNPLRSVAVLRFGRALAPWPVGEAAFGGKVALVGRDVVRPRLRGTQGRASRSPRRSSARGDTAASAAPAPLPTRRGPPPGARTLERAEVERRLAHRRCLASWRRPRSCP